jgi:hypothetical protein
MREVAGELKSTEKEKNRKQSATTLAPWTGKLSQRYKIQGKPGGSHDRFAGLAMG